MKKNWHLSENKELTGVGCEGTFHPIWTDARTGKADRVKCNICGKEVCKANFRFYGIKP